MFKIWCPRCKRYMVNLNHTITLSKTEIHIFRDEGECVGCNKAGYTEYQIIPREQVEEVV